MRRVRLARGRIVTASAPRRPRASASSASTAVGPLMVVTGLPAAVSDAGPRPSLHTPRTVTPPSGGMLGGVDRILAPGWYADNRIGAVGRESTLPVVP